MSSTAVTPRTIRWRAPEPGRAGAKFLPVLRQAVAAAPGRSDLRLELVKLLFRTGAMAEIVDRERRAVAEDGAAPELLCLIGRAALAVGDHQLAVRAQQRSAAGGFAAALGHLAEALQNAAQPEAALRAALQRLESLPSDFAAIKVAARVMLGRGEAERLWRLCLDLRERGAWGSWFSTVMASTAATLGMEDEFATLVDRSRWFSTTSLPVAVNLNRGLAAELLGLRSGAGEMRIDGLETVGGPLAQELLTRIRNAIEVYVAQREPFAADPMNIHRPESASLYSWLITIHDRQHHGWHIHQAGWISGVYYVAMPAVASGDDGQCGAIEFGPFPFVDGGTSFESFQWHVSPQPGLLVLFPSYYPHHTRPTQVRDPRICVPFDVRPRATPAD